MPDVGPGATTRTTTRAGTGGQDNDDHSGHGGGDERDAEEAREEAAEAAEEAAEEQAEAAAEAAEEAAEAPAIVGDVPAGSIEIRIVSDDVDGFSPSTVTVDAGQSVTFVNAHDDEHTATGSGFDTGIIAPGRLATVVLDEPGAFAYACQIHPEMTGRIGVRGPDGTVPPAARAAPPPAGAATVRIVNLAFDPPSLAVDTGTTVAWTNDDAVPHTVTALDGGFDSGILDPGAGFSWAFTDPGSFGYRCDLHPRMQGSVEVSGDAIAQSATAAEAGSPEAAATTGTAASLAAPGDIQVAIVDFAFEPATLDVAAGATIVWTNTGQAPHTVTGDFADSGTLEPGQTFRHAFEEQGTFDYVCSFHPQMTATVQVGAATDASPAAGFDGTAGDATNDETGTPARAAQNDGGLAGAWRVVITPDADAELAPQQAVVALHVDRTLGASFAAIDAGSALPAIIGPGHGAWREQGDRGYALTVVALRLDEDQGFAGTLTIRETGTLDESGDVFRGIFAFEITDADGETTAAGGGTTRGSRIRVQEPGGSGSSGAVATPIDRASPSSATVTIQGLTFDPATIDVGVGTTVTWVNRDEVPHTATSQDGEFDTGRLDQERSGSHAFDRPGSYAYGCAFHPEMVGTVVVS